MRCPNCGGTITGDGYSTVLHCENVDFDIWRDYEPDAEPLYCNDGIPILLEPGITYVTKEQVDKYGADLLMAINSVSLKPGFNDVKLVIIDEKE